jgi:hypothetical protein
VIGNKTPEQIDEVVAKLNKLKAAKEFTSKIKTIEKHKDLISLNIGLKKLESKPTCKTCHSFDHWTKGCLITRCWVCHQPGHNKKNCPHIALCQICLLSDHKTSECTSDTSLKLKTMCSFCRRYCHRLAKCAKASSRPKKKFALGPK